jgi:hypothetical protein
VRDVTNRKHQLRVLVRMRGMRSLVGFSLFAAGPSKSRFRHSILLSQSVNP